MSSVSVKNFENDERLHIHLQLTTNVLLSACAAPSTSNSSFVKFTLSRLKTEELKLAIDRLRLNLNKKQSKKSKKKVKTQSAETLKTKEVEDESFIPIEILHNGTVLDQTVVNELAWVDGALLKVGDEKILISFNTPCVQLDKLPATILEGCPLFPGAQVDFTTQDQCQFFWKAFDKKDIDKIKMQISRETVDLEGTIQSDSFTPQSNDVGKYVLLACIPQRGHTVKGKLEAVVSNVAVTKGPGFCPFETRHKQTKSYSESGSFRVLTYNLLAEVYSDTDFSRDHLFHYCPPEFLTMDYRKHLLLKEIVAKDSGRHSE
ncbi:2',5'-phosphodiesterase 12 [Elysia marginata]|uniref:2',5'-phosphodiesterase 12 n=1 Tax=Elysia marginata TaxID=1093978 RepID=A0AAV4GJT8_9GAST|nr:2',5'-phosphodiesterase 12 [Elysia marginata]